MKIVNVVDFMRLLDKKDMLNIPFLTEMRQTFNIEVDVFFWEGRQNNEALKKRIRSAARQRKWKLRNLIVLHRRHTMFRKKGDFCLMVTTKTPEQFAKMCNRFYRMRAFL